MAQSKIQSVETIAKYKIKLREQPIAFPEGLFSLFTLRYSLTSSLPENSEDFTIEVGPEDTCSDVEARVAKKHNLLGQLTWRSPGDTRDVNKLWKENQGSHLVKKIFPNTSLFYLGVVSGNKAVKAKIDAGTEKHDYAIEKNFATKNGDQDNWIGYPEQHPGRVVESKARVRENIASGTAKQKNQIGGSRNAVQPKEDMDDDS